MTWCSVSGSELTTTHSRFNGHAVAVVVKSEDSGFPVGTHVYGVFPYQAYLYFPKQKSEPDAFLGGAPLTILHNKENLPWSAYIGAAGMPGRTAYMCVTLRRCRGVRTEADVSMTPKRSPGLGKRFQRPRPVKRPL